MGYSFFDVRFVIIAGLILIAMLIPAVIRRAISVRKVENLSQKEKDILLNQLANPFGYEYILEQDIFITRRDAWQRQFGYEAAFDEEMLGMGMHLSSEKERLLEYQMCHWWLGGFVVGKRIKPERTRALLQIHFPDSRMKNAFVIALLQTGFLERNIRER